MVDNSRTYLVITPFFPSECSFVGSYIFDQLNEIRKQSDFNIHIIKVVSLLSKERDYSFGGFTVRVFKLIDFPFFIFPGFFNWINKIRIKSFLRRNKIEDIKFSHSHVSYPSAYLVEDIQCKKIIQHHGLDVLQLMNGRNKYIRSIQRSFLIQNTIKYLNDADLNIGVSNLVLQKLRFFENYDPKREFVLYNGVDTSKFFKKKTCKSSVFTVGCIANFWDIKAQIILIKSAQRILEGRDINLRLIGSGPTIKSCKEYVFKNKLSKYISFEKEMAHEDLNDFYNGIDLFVLPSYSEALGCVYLEAWATETPFIAIKGQGISEITPDQDRMLSIKNDIEDLADKIIYFMDHSFELRFVSDFNIENTIYEFLSLDIFNKDV